MRTARCCTLALALLGALASPSDAIILYEAGAGFGQPGFFDLKQDITPRKIDVSEFSWSGALCPAPGTPNFLCGSLLSEAGIEGGRLVLRSKTRIERTNASSTFPEAAAYADSRLFVSEVGGYAGTAPKAAFYLGLSGQLSKTATNGDVSVYAFAVAELDAGTLHSIQCAGELDCTPRPDPYKVIVEDWNPAQGFRLRLRSDVGANVAFNGPSGWDAEVVADFADTLEVVAIQILDENEVPIPGVTLTALDGEGKPIVTFPNQPVPEPAQALLVATGALVLAAARRRART
jgi:hypothetical protein